MAFEYLDCGNCGDAEAVQSDSEGAFWDGDEYECPTCGGTLIISVDEDQAYTNFDHCRHNRMYDEDCIPCEVEGTDKP